MSRAVLISIRPEWVKKILTGEKTLEVRKNRPNMETPFKCYIYCTNSGVATGMWGKHGKVVGEFVCDRIEPITPATEPYGIYDVDDDFVKQTGLVNGALWDYGHGKTLYGWHISNLEIYDTPKELPQFRKCCGTQDCDKCQFWENTGEYAGCLTSEERRLNRAPESWRYVEELR